MRYVLDTNVISALRVLGREPIVQAWAASVPIADLFTTATTIAEIERVFTTSGRFDFLVQVACPNTQVLDSVLDQIGAMTGVRASESLIHLSTKIDRAV